MRNAKSCYRHFMRYNTSHLLFLFNISETITSLSNNKSYTNFELFEQYTSYNFHI